MTEEFEEDKPWLWRPPEGGYIGRRGLRPKEAAEKVTGRAVYTRDVYLPGMLYLKIYRSPYAHARIKSMDTSKAEALPGVWAVIRYDDPDIDLSDPYKFRATKPGMPWYWWRDSILPDTADSYRIRVGALVVAESEEICDQALKLIGEGIEWEKLPFILDPEEAAQPEAPLMHPELNPKNNIWQDSVTLNLGDVEKGFASSDHVIEFSYIKKDDDIWAGVEPGCMVAQWKGDELEFWYHGQFVGVDAKHIIAPAFKNDTRDPSKLKVKIHSPHNGGTFGGNAMGVAVQLARYAAIAARKIMRPVKVVDDYAMSWEGISFETGTAHFKVGFNNDGTIVAISIDAYQLGGLHGGFKIRDALKTPNVRIHEIHAYWSKAHESCWKDGAINCAVVNLIINKVAAHLGMDPIKIQLLNDGIMPHGMAWVDENVKKRLGVPVRDSLKEVIEAGKKDFDWDKKWHPPGTRKLPNSKMHGVGFYAMPSWMTGLRFGSNWGNAPGISLAPNGTATVFFRRTDNGQSAFTTYCQIVADEIGLRYEDVKIEFKEFFHFDALFPTGSMGASANSYTLVVNSRAMKKLLLEYALKPLPAPARFPGLKTQPTPSPFEGKTIEELDIKDGIIFEKANPSNTLPVSKVTSAHCCEMEVYEGGPFFVGNIPVPPEVEERSLMARQAIFVEVEVDTETGQVDITKLVHPYDVGQSINPDVNEQQLYGGAYSGLGVSATEAIFYDKETGIKLNDNHIDYPMLTILDVGEIECPIVETHLGWSAYGIYGCSEAGKAATAAALLVPAVYNAIGKWIEDTPITPDKILKALGKA
jgi:xanthine dehydrogenase molybdenum-binding subunit